MSALRGNFKLKPSNNKISRRPHQGAAIKAVINELKKADRTHIVMACGTGKTATALWIAESLKPKTIAIFVPSLALINQFMKEWLSLTKWKSFKILAICSDDTVTNDIEPTSILCEEINFPVSADSEEIKKFLQNEKSKLKILFCTYHSSPLLRSLKIDLGIFDEAHKTAGYGKELFCYALDDKNIKINKRLFMTATPRHASIVKKTKDGEKVPVYSMDNEALYGKRAYTVGFREAINLGLICDYKVIISIANANANANAGGCMEAARKALKEGILKTKTNKIITYHRSVREAQEFSKNETMPNYKHLHINGKTPMSDRLQIMKSFKDARRAIICNAKCLTEGVDVPSIDMVSFLSPKTSKIDIVQAIGRTLRKSYGKEVGYVFLPVHIDNSIEDQAAAIEASDFSHIWEVLHALAEQDADLNDVIREISRESGEAGFNYYDKLDKFIEVPFKTNIAFINSIKAKIIENIHSGWDLIYGKLKVHLKDNPKERGTRTTNEYLAYWISKQRDLFNKGLLSPDKENFLCALGVQLKTRTIDESQKWDARYTQLAGYYKKNKNIYFEARECPKELRNWCMVQREKIRKGLLTPNQLKLLENIDFPKQTTTVVENKWLAEFALYKKDLAQGGGSKKWYDWGHRQRINFENGKLSQLRTDALMSINFDFTILRGFDFAKVAFTRHPSYSSFMKELKEHGNIRVKSIELRKIDKILKDKECKGELAPQSIQLLEDAGFIFKGSIDARTERNIRQYIYHKKNHIPIDYKNTHALFCWVRDTRCRRKKGILKQQVINRLNEIKFEWKDPPQKIIRATNGRIVSVYAKDQLDSIV